MTPSTPSTASASSNATAPTAGKSAYVYPPLTLLKKAPKTELQPGDTAVGTDEHAANMTALVRILGEFGITVTPGKIHPGSAVTCYEVVPAPGVRVERIAKLGPDIALRINAQGGHCSSPQSVRILAPIPGSPAISVEIPNKNATDLHIRDLLESKDWNRNKAEIPVALGRSIYGHNIVSDLGKSLPFVSPLLVAGSAGTGASDSTIHTIITSIVYHNSPDDVRFIIFDKKNHNLKYLNTLPHMLVPSVEVAKSPAVFEWLSREHGRRFQLLGNASARNIIEFNRHVKDSQITSPPPVRDNRTDHTELLDYTGACKIIRFDSPGTFSPPHHDNHNVANTQAAPKDAPPQDIHDAPERLPHIVVIISELADLLAVPPQPGIEETIEETIVLLAQIAHVAGIHVIVATQRPSANVITNLNRTDFPTRLAFKVASPMESCAILDDEGAESLSCRHGDMLLVSTRFSRPMRAQRAHVSEDELTSIIDFLKKENPPPRYAQDLLDEINSTAPLKS